MAAPTLTRRLILQLGDGATPTELFGYPCGANNFTLTLTNNTGEVEVLDCDTPLDSPATLTRYLMNQDTQVSFEGQLARTVLPTWRAWADDGSTKNVRMRIDESAVNNGGYWGFPGILQNFELSKESSGIVTISGTVVAAGPRTWTAAT
jgi:Phage tail tube protein